VLECRLALEAIAESFSQITPQVIHGALTFRKFVEFAGELQDNRLKDLKNLCDLKEKLVELTEVSALKEECDELRERCMALGKDFEERRQEYKMERLRNEKLKVENRQLIKDCATHKEHLLKHRETKKRHVTLVSDMAEKHKQQYDQEWLSNERLKVENSQLIRDCTRYEERLQEHYDMLKKLQDKKTCSHCKCSLDESQRTQDQFSVPLDKGKAVDEITEVKVAKGASLQAEPLQGLEGPKSMLTVEDLQQ